MRTRHTRRLHIAAGILVAALLFAPCAPGEPREFGVFARDDVLVVVAPHPDDETLCCAGAIERAHAAGARVETLRPEAPFDTVMARAFAPLPELLEKVAPLVGPGTRVLAMKGKQPDSEIEAVPRGWRLAASRELSVPGLDAARCLLRYELNAAAER